MPGVGVYIRRVWDLSLPGRRRAAVLRGCVSLEGGQSAKDVRSCGPNPPCVLSGVLKHMMQPAARNSGIFDSQRLILRGRLPSSERGGAMSEAWVSKTHTLSRVKGRNVKLHIDGALRVAGSRFRPPLNVIRKVCTMDAPRRIALQGMKAKTDLRQIEGAMADGAL